MTIEEAATTIYEQNGYLVIGSSHKREVGGTVVNPFMHVHPGERMNVALRVIGESSSNRRGISVHRDGSVVVAVIGRTR